MALAVMASSLFTGCSYAVKSGTNLALGFSERHIVPPILAMNDSDMVCNSGNALTPAIMATKDMGRSYPHSCVALHGFWHVCGKSGS